MPAEYRHLAHADVPVPIGWNQTTSQPHLVELMIRLLELRPGHKVLEVGTGSGYQTAILASLPGVDVYSVEIIAALADQARARLHELGLGHVHLAVADGRQGWPEHAPYNGVIVAAAAEDVPPALEAQLAEDGRLVIPIGPRTKNRCCGNSSSAAGACRVGKWST